MANVPVYDDRTQEIVATVEYNSCLDHWDGRNWSSGSTGRHVGFSQLSDGRFVMIHGTDWQGEKNNATLVNPEEIVKEAIAHGNESELEGYPELMEILDSFSSDTPITSKTFSIRVNVISDGKDDIERKIDEMKGKIVTFLQENNISMDLS